MFTDIIMFNYIRPVKYNIQTLNVSRDHAKVLGLLIIQITKSNIIIPLW